MKKLVPYFSVGVLVIGLIFVGLIATRARAAETVEISVTEFTFTPVHLVVNSGDTFYFKNNGSQAHQILEETRVTWDSPVLQPGDLYPVSITSPSQIETYTYVTTGAS